MFVKLVSTVTPAYLCGNYFLADVCIVAPSLLKGEEDLLEELEEGALCEDDVGVIPIEHTCEDLQVRTRLLCD